MRGKTRAGVAALTLTGVTLLGGMVVAPSASAATNGGGCRGYAAEPGGVSMSPCAFGDGGNGIAGVIDVSDPNGLMIDICAQLLQVNPNGSTTEVADYTCNGWSNATSQEFDTATIGVGPGTYVVQTGFWATINGNYGYYGNVQSPRITVS